MLSSIKYKQYSQFFYHIVPIIFNFMSTYIYYQNPASYSRSLNVRHVQSFCNIIRHCHPSFCSITPAEALLYLADVAPTWDKKENLCLTGI